MINNNQKQTTDWWSSLKHGGLLITPTKLNQYFPHTPHPLPTYLVDRLRRHITALQGQKNPNLASNSKLEGFFRN